MDEPTVLFGEIQPLGSGGIPALRGNTMRIDPLLREWGYILGGGGMDPEIAAQTLLVEVPGGHPAGSDEGGYSAVAALRAARNDSGDTFNEYSAGAAADGPAPLFDEAPSYAPVRGGRRGRLVRGPSEGSRPLQQGRPASLWSPLSEYSPEGDRPQLRSLDDEFRRGDLADMLAPGMLGDFHGGDGRHGDLFEGDEEPDLLLG